MDYFENHQFWFIRLMLYSIGLWPYADRKSQFIKLSVHIFLLTMIALALLIKCIILFPNIKLIIRVISYFTISIKSLLTYLILIYKIAKMKELWYNIERNWRKLERTNRISIAERYACKGKLLSLYVIILVILYYVFIYVDIFLPSLLDVVAPLNRTRRHKTAIPIELLGDYKNYDLPVIIISVFLIAEPGILLSILLSKFIIFVHHACLLFTLAGDILERGFTIVGKNNTTDKDKILYEAIVESVEYHSIAIQLVNTYTEMAKCFKMIDEGLGGLKVQDPDIERFEKVINLFTTRKEELRCRRY